MRSNATFKSREYFVEAIDKNDYELYQNKMSTYLKLLRKVEILNFWELSALFKNTKPKTYET